MPRIRDCRMTVNVVHFPFVSHPNIMSQRKMRFLGCKKGHGCRILCQLCTYNYLYIFSCLPVFPAELPACFKQSGIWHSDDGTLDWAISFMTDEVLMYFIYRRWVCKCLFSAAFSAIYLAEKACSEAILHRFSFVLTRNLAICAAVLFNVLCISHSLSPQKSCLIHLRCPGVRSDVN